MKLLSIALMSMMFCSFNVMADETHNHSVEEKLKEAKSSRRKKVEMCHDCGKPESQCDCPEEVKKKEAEAKKKHSADDGHGH